MQEMHSTYQPESQSRHAVQKFVRIKTLQMGLGDMEEHQI